VSLGLLLSLGNGDLDLNARVNADGSNLSHNLRVAVQVNDTFVDVHFITIPSFGTFSVGSLAARDFEVLGGHANGATVLKLLLLGTSDQILTDFLQRLDFAARQSDTNTVDGGIRPTVDSRFGGFGSAH